MSRTYRHRHLPRIPGSARKYVSGSTYRRMRFHQAKVAKRELGYDPWDWRSNPNIDWSERIALDRYVAERFPPPVGHVGSHPYLGYSIVYLSSRIKKFYRKISHRYVRHHGKALNEKIRRGARDPDAVVYPDIADCLSLGCLL